MTSFTLEEDRKKQIAYIFQNIPQMGSGIKIVPLLTIAGRKCILSGSKLKKVLLLSDYLAF